MHTTKTTPPVVTDNAPRDTAADLRALLADIKGMHGFLTVPMLARLAELDRIRQVLVRCGSGRFQCPAQDAAHFIQIIERDAKANPFPADIEAHDPAKPVGDYIRDVSLPTTDPIWR